MNNNWCRDGVQIRVEKKGTPFSVLLLGYTSECIEANLKLVDERPHTRFPLIDDELEK
jgi:hypothetical protein